ncbi:MAG: DNA-binding protein [Pseudomonas sp.]|nr:MAG: DNA-binding protein [Pseudomonas sp.]
MVKAAKRLLDRTSRARLATATALVLVLLSLYQARIHHLDDRLYYYISTHPLLQSADAESVSLGDYSVVVEAKAVAGVDNNLSGLTFDPDRNLLWAVTNGPNELFALNTSGEVIQRHALDGFHDVEAVSYLGDGQLVLSEERRQTLVIVNAPQPGETLDRADYKGLTIDYGEGDNDGYEGLAYDLSGDRLFVAKERKPIRLLEITGLRASMSGDFSLNIQDRSALVREKVFATDLSSVVFDQRTGHLLLLSDESKLLIEIGDDSEVVGFSSLAAGAAGLLQDIPQAEGVTIDANGSIYVVSEPNLFYSFERSVSQKP